MAGAPYLKQRRSPYLPLLVAVPDRVPPAQDREALFENMISGPGIAATKFPRRGRPRDVVLTLVLPGHQGAAAGEGGSSTGMSPSPGGAGVGGDAAYSSSSGRSAFGWRGGAASLARAASNMFEGESDFLYDVGRGGRDERDARASRTLPSASPARLG